MTKSKIFFIFSLSFIGGVGTASFYYPRIFGGEFIFSAFILALIVFCVFYKNQPAMIFSGVLLFFALGIFLTSGKLEKISNLGNDGEKFSGKVMIIKEPEMSSIAQKIVVQPKNPELSGKFFVNAPVFPEYNYGDNLQVDCTLKIQDNKNLDFDYKMYLAKDGIFWECQKAKIENLNTNSGNKIYAALIRIKNNFKDNIYSLIPAPESGLLVGLILGGSRELSKEIQNNFSRTGLTHIVAVSGYNVTIVAEYLMIFGIFLGLWRAQAFWFAATGIIIFVIMTGVSSSAVRAGVMGILLIWAMKNGRLANSQNAVLFSAVVMLLANPLLLRWDIGFQLSFLAIMGIICLQPNLNYLLRKIPNPKFFP